MLRYNGTTIGTMVIEQDGKRFTIQIRQSNCLATFIHVTKAEDKKGYYHTLYTFFADEKHLKNIIKGDGTPFADKVVKIKLNMQYKECFTLLKHLVKFYKIECYYK
jgi:hypothetical protein